MRTIYIFSLLLRLYTSTFVWYADTQNPNAYFPILTTNDTCIVTLGLIDISSLANDLRLGVVVGDEVS